MKRETIWDDEKEREFIAKLGKNRRFHRNGNRVKLLRNYIESIRRRKVWWPDADPQGLEEYARSLL